MNTASCSPSAGYVGQKEWPETLVAVKQPCTHACTAVSIDMRTALARLWWNGGQMHHYLMYLALYLSSITQTLGGHPVEKIGQRGHVRCNI